jgi:CRP/FNR family transcriptional regulator, cyclic AMP receptor protein
MGGMSESDRRSPMEFVSRMMDGSISYDPKARLEPVLSGAAVKEGDKIERLKEVRIFEECSQRQLRSIARIARIFDAPAGTMLTRADEPGDEFFLILDGTASVSVATEKRGSLGPGAFFGEMSLLDGGPRSATIVAETPVRLLVISRRNFSVLLGDVPGLTQSLLMTLSRRVRQAEESAERVGGALAGL